MPALALRPLVGPTLLWSPLLSSVTGLPISRPVSSRADAAFTRLGCYTDVPQRALTGAFKGSDAMTVEMCADFCSAYQYFGVEYGLECYCGNTRDPESVVALDAECSFACLGAGNASETCGAGMRLDLFVNSAYSSYNPEDSASAGTPYIGCFVDAGARVLPERVISTDDMTLAKCAANCAGYAYLGTEWSRKCYCGNVAPTEAAPKSDCNMPCAGNAADICGFAHFIRGLRHTTVAYIVGFKYVLNYKIDVFERVELLFRLASVQKGHHACVEVQSLPTRRPHPSCSRRR